MTLKKKRSLRRTWEILYLMAPGVLLVLLVTIVPTFYAFKLSLYEMRFLETVKFVGLDNYRKFFQDSASMNSLKASLVYVVSTVVISLPLGYLFALFLNSRIRYRQLFRSVIIIPWVLAQVVVALLWKWILDPTYGPIAYYMTVLGWNKINFLGNLAMPTLIGVNIWRSFPFPMVLILAALQTIPEELNESARIDGANVVQIFRNITIPYTIATVLIATITTTLYSFNMVTLIFTLTAGGPFSQTDVMSLKVYKEAFEDWHISYAATVGIIIFFCNVIFSLSYILMLRKKPIQ